MAWNFLQVETTGLRLHPVMGPGGLTREQAHARVRRLLLLHVEGSATVGLVEAWDAGARDDTVFAGSLLWAIYEADDAEAGARAWVDDLVDGLRRSGSKVRAVW